MVISGEKAVQQLEELLILMINSFKGVKDVVKFMSFEELEIVGFQTQTQLENKGNVTPSGDTIGIGDLDEYESEKSGIEESDQNESVSSDINPNKFHKWYEDTNRKREKMKKEEGDKDKLELSAMIENVKKKGQEKKAQDLKSDHDFNSVVHNDALSKFSKTNFIKGRTPKLHKQLNPYSKNDPELSVGNTGTPSKKNDNNLDELQEFVFPDLEKVNIDSGNEEDFLSKHWIELLEVCYTLISDVFLRIGNIQVSDEVTKLFSHIQN